MITGEKTDGSIIDKKQAPFIIEKGGSIHIYVGLSREWERASLGNSHEG